MSPRKLTPDETALWQKVVEKADRLHPNKSPLPMPGVSTGPSAIKPMAQAAQPQAAKPPPPDPHTAPPKKPDAKRLKKVKRGKMRPEARLDLHGMTLDRAHPALMRFILSSQSSGRRLVLVITGKGRSSDGAAFAMAPYERGVLNRQVPHWLSQPPLSQAVIDVSPAYLQDGGDGAYYVFLRKTRSR